MCHSVTMLFDVHVQLHIGAGGGRGEGGVPIDVKEAGFFSAVMYDFL